MHTNTRVEKSSLNCFATFSKKLVVLGTARLVLSVAQHDNLL